MTGFIIFGVTVLLIISPFVFSIKESKDKRIKRCSYLLLAAGTLILLVGLIAGNSVKKSSSSDSTSKADGFTIEAFDVVMDVQKDGKVDVSETITINWYETGHHGIYRSVSEWLEYTTKDGKTQSRKAEISNVLVTGETFTTSSTGDRIKIKIGDANKTLSIGTKTYQLSYTYDMGGDPYEGFDEFLFHTFGDHWGTQIKNPTIQINMPNSFDASSVKLFADRYRKNEITTQGKIEIKGNTIKISLPADYNLRKELTVDIELPEGYFDSASGKQYGNGSLILCIVCACITLLAFVLWLIFGKDYKKIPNTVEFYSPEGLDPSEIGYIYDGLTGKKAAVSLIISLLSKNIIKIDSNKIISRCENVTQSQMNALSENEKEVFKHLFPGTAASVSLVECKNFYLVYDQIKNTNDNNLYTKINEAKSYALTIISALLYVVSSVLWVVSYTSVQDLNPAYSYVYYITIPFIILTGVFTLIMSRPSKYGEQIKARIKGFYQYIKLAQKDELEARMAENPNYYFDVLPYAYIFGISTQWAKKFEDIPIPTNESYDFNIFDFVYFDALSSHIPSAPSSSDGSSGGGGGGGCSSCGGGCSSCGGGGSW